MMSSPDVDFGSIFCVRLGGDVYDGYHIDSYGALLVLFILITCTVSIHPVLFIIVDGEMI